MDYPIEFTDYLKGLLKDEYDLFWDAINSERSFGFRFNPLKVELEGDSLDMLKNALGVTGSVEWCDEGYYYDNSARPGKSIYHEAGAIYIQEPSAMAVVQALNPQPGDRICDLCAAPGGKTSHIAGRMQGEGLLVSNEIVSDRAKILARNVERMGIRNCIVTNEDPDGMLAHFPGFFNKIVVDAPCSGEGMFRKDDTAVTEWSVENVKMCAERQKMILDRASQMLAPGGILVYSTCTFEPAEDEEIIGDFLREHPDWHIISTGLEDVLSSGRPEWMEKPMKELGASVRIWPHINKGEGHFLAKLEKDGEYTALEISNTKNRDKKRKQYEDIIKELDIDILTSEYERYVTFSDNVYLLPEGITENRLKGLKTVRCGLHIAEIKKGRIEPAHALAMSLCPKEAKNCIELCDKEAIMFLRGESIPKQSNDIPSGTYVLVTYNDMSLGWGKYVNSVVKNHYPKGLRRNLE